MLFMKVLEQHTFSKDCVVQVVWEDDKNPLPPLVFDVNAFNKAFTKNPLFFVNQCKVCNKFFQSLTLAHQRLIFEYFAEVHQKLLQVNEENNTQIVNELSTFSDKVFVEQIDIYPLLRKVVDTLEIALPEMGEKGTRVQDSEMKTFTQEEYPQVHAIVLMCKILLPLIGLGSKQLKTYCGADRVDTTLYSIIVGIFADQRSGFNAIFQKLTYYVRSEVKKSLQKDKKQNSNQNTSYLFNMTNQGFCEELFIEYVLANILCKKLVTFDLTQEEDTEKKPDVMVCICKACESITQSKLTSFRKRSEYVALYDQPSSRKGGMGIEDNTSILENGFKISGPADWNKFIEVSLKHSRERIFRAHKIDEKDVITCKKFYEKNPYLINPLSHGVIASLLGEFIGGSSVIPSIRADQFTELLIVCQLVLIRLNLWDIASMLSVKSSDIKVVNISPEVSRNKNFERLNEFIDLKRLCPGFCEREVEVKTSPGNFKKVMERISIETHLQGIVSWATEYEHTYNLPRLIWDKSPFPEDRRPSNGDFVDIGFDFTKHLCKFYIYCHGDEDDHLSQSSSEQMPQYTFINRDSG